MYKGWTQTDYQNKHKIQTKRTKKHRTTEEEMEGPTSSGGSRNRLTCLNLQEHDDDDDDKYTQDTTKAITNTHRTQ